MGQVAALEWWKKSGLPLKIGNVVSRLRSAERAGGRRCRNVDENQD